MANVEPWAKRPVHAVEHPVEHLAPAGDRADRDEAAGQRLGEQHEVGLDPPVLRRQKAPGPPHAGLDLVGDQQGAVRAAQPGRRRQIVVVRNIDPLALDRLDHECGDVAPGERPLERLEIIERDARAVADERSEAGAKVLIAAQGHGAVGQAVEGVVAVQDGRAAGRGAAELDRRLRGFGAGVAEEQLRQPRHVAGEALGEQAGEQGHVELHQAGELAAQHLLERAGHGRMVAPEREHAEPAQQIEIALAVGVEQMRPLGAHVVHGEAEGAQDAQQLRVEMAIEQLELVAAPFLDEPCQIDRHRSFPRLPWSRDHSQESSVREPPGRVRRQVPRERRNHGGQDGSPLRRCAQDESCISARFASIIANRLSAILA